MARGRGYGRGAAEGSIWPKIALAVLGIAFLLHLISFGAPNWAETNPKRSERREHIGLWRYCVEPIGGGTDCSDFIDIITGDWLKAAQSFGTLALFSMLGAIAVAGAYAFVPDIEGDMRVIGAHFAATGLTFLCLMVECGVFGGKYHEYFEEREKGIWLDVAELSWAFGLGVTSCVLTFLALACMVVEVIVGAEVD